VLTVCLAFGWVALWAWLTIGSLNPLTVAVGSLTVATGCEFSVMLSSGRRDRRAHIARTVTVAALAGSAGYLVLTLSGVAMLHDLGVLLTASVVLSYLAARLVAWLFPPAPAPRGVEPTQAERPCVSVR